MIHASPVPFATPDDAAAWLCRQIFGGAPELYFAFLEYSETHRELSMDERLCTWTPSASASVATASPHSVLPGWTGQPADDFERAVRAIERAGIVVERNCHLGDADGQAKHQKIKLDRIEDPLHRLRVLLHELAHVVLGNCSVDIDYGVVVGDLDYEQVFDADFIDAFQEGFRDGNADRSYEERWSEEVTTDSVAYLLLRKLCYHRSEWATYVTTCDIVAETLLWSLEELDGVVDKATAILASPP